MTCVARLCTLQVTRLEVTRPLEAGLCSFVLAVSMKTPHRFLRSNEIPLPPSGTLTVPLRLNFSLQVHHLPVLLVIVVVFHGMGSRAPHSLSSGKWMCSGV